MRISSWSLIGVLGWLAFCGGRADAVGPPIPFVKQWTAGSGRLACARVDVQADAALANEAEALRAALVDRGIAVETGGTPVRLALAAVPIPERASRYRAAIERQAYRLDIDSSGVTVRGATPAGVFYGVQTLSQLVADDRTLPCVGVLDWPDFAVRAVMIDMARANENAAYYTRMIEFCARYKLNRLHLHLTDDENASLYEEHYPTLMHPQAWTADRLGPLIELAARRHIELVPEIESLGHARLFVRHPERSEFLHQTTDTKPKKSWAGTELAGLTNVLCPASERTYEYLGRMYAGAARIFPAREIHIGCDEVDMTECARCRAKFGELTPAEWFLRHLRRCQALATEQGCAVGIWGDMLLHHRDIVDGISTNGTIIYDWQYQPGMTDESVRFFTDRGFDVIACPALVCHPHMILPSDFNYGNIQRFAEIGRANDLLGFDTTVWTPIRYLSDALWPGIAYAAAQAWGGSNWDDDGFYRAFAADFFGSSEGDAFGKTFRELADLRWWLDDFKLSCWSDEEGLTAAIAAAGGKSGRKAEQHRTRLREILQSLEAIDGSIRRNRTAWEAFVQSVRIFDTVLEHLLAAPEVRGEGVVNRARVAALDARCRQALSWIEADWDRNRYADDPYKADLNRTGQHLLDHFRRMHEFHEVLLQSADAAQEDSRP